MIEPPASIGSQMDALAAHLIERIDRVEANISHANSRIEVLRCRVVVIGIATTIIGLVAGIALSLAIKLMR